MRSYNRLLLKTMILALVAGLAFPVVAYAANSRVWTYRTEAQCVWVESWAYEAAYGVEVKVHSTDENWYQIDCEADNDQPPGEIRGRTSLQVFDAAAGVWRVCRSDDSWWINGAWNDWMTHKVTWGSPPCGRGRTYGCSCAGQVFENAAWRDANKVWIWSGSGVWN